MKDIAVLAGVSQPTVSIILNNSDRVRIAEETRQRVLNAAQQLGYVTRKPTLHSRLHHRIAFVVNSINMHDPFLNAVVAAREQAWQYNHVLVVFDYEEQSDIQQSLIDELSTGDYCALIYARNMLEAVDCFDLPFPLPTVMLNCYSKDPETKIPAILPADLAGGFNITNHLISQGYKRIAYLGGEPWAEPSQQRLEGYKQALLQADYIPREELIGYGNWSVQQSYLQTQRFLALSAPPDAIFCASDLMAVGCYQAIANAGLSIPEDVAIAGYDNQLLASELTPDLTSIDLPYDDMARLAVNRLLDKRSSSVEILTQRIEGEVTIRHSTIR
ncbi:LacI family DNA-binding transcriptional regulator [Celerinatantimonas sp. YJH-8]